MRAPAPAPAATTRRSASSLDPAQQGRAARALPRHPEEVHRGMDPGVIAGEAGRPDHGIDVQLAILECHGRAGCADRAAVERQPSWAGADQRLALLQSPSEPRVGRDPHHAERLEEAEDVDARESLREPRLARADGEVDVARGGELLGDLEAGVAATDDEHAPVRHAGRIPVLGAVDLRHVDRERRPRGTWNGPVATITWSACSVRSASSTSNPARTAITRLSYSTGRSRAYSRQVVDDLVAGRIVVGISGERRAGQAGVPGGREQPQRVPALAPGGGGLRTPPRGS